MSEYQCYEFVALDRPLTAKQMAELRAVSTRAEISPTRFWNEYQWGELKADLVSAAASGSAAAMKDDAPFRRWLAALPAKEKDAWLTRAANDPELGLGGELLRAFRATTKVEHRGTRRTVRELRALADVQRAEREKAQAERARKTKAQADAARQRHLTKLARDVEGAWSKLEKLVEASDYDVAVKLAIDLRDLATREATAPAFARRFEALRKRRLRRRGFFDRWKRANESDSRER